MNEQTLTFDVYMYIALVDLIDLDQYFRLAALTILYVLWPWSVLLFVHVLGVHCLGCCNLFNRVIKLYVYKTGKNKENIDIKTKTKKTTKNTKKQTTKSIYGFSPDGIKLGIQYTLLLSEYLLQSNTHIKTVVANLCW